MRRIATLVLPVACAALAALPATATADGPRCHGEAATFTGTSGPDRIKVGDADLGRDPVLVLAGGRDRVIFSGNVATGDVTVCGGPGADYVVALEDARVDSYLLDGGTGADRLGDDSDVDNSGVGAMVLDGGGGDDELLGSDFADRLVGGSGDDLMLSIDGDDRMAGGTGDDSLFSKGGDDRGLGGEGDDRIELGGGTDLADGDAGEDECKGTETEVSCEG